MGLCTQGFLYSPDKISSCFFPPSPLLCLIIHCKDFDIYPPKTSSLLEFGGVSVSFACQLFPFWSFFFFFFPVPRSSLGCLQPLRLSPLWLDADCTLWLPQDLSLRRGWREPSDHTMPLHGEPALRPPVMFAAVDQELRHSLLRAVQIRVHHGDQAQAAAQGEDGCGRVIECIVTLSRDCGTFLKYFALWKFLILRSTLEKTTESNKVADCWKKMRRPYKGNSVVVWIALMEWLLQHW